ncbi:hypothetical protein AAZX31_05G098700 [Glycine max]
MLLKVVKFFRLMLLEVAKKATMMLSSHASTRLTPNSYRTRRSLRSTTTSVLPSLASPSSIVSSLATCDPSLHIEHDVVVLLQVLSGLSLKKERGSYHYYGMTISE